MFSKREYANKDQSAKDYVCKSTDTKPTGKWGSLEITNGSSFLEIDTHKIAFYDSDTQTWM